MIISASRRTDIPAFYSDWFMNRVHDGYVQVKNPFNPLQIRTVSLLPENVDVIVFWTKNPSSLMNRLNELNDYRYYFLFSLTAYGPELEKNVPAEKQLIDTFRILSERIGPQNVIWRYDPVILTETMNDDFHLRRFEKLANDLQDYTGTCIFSFVEMYEKCRRNMKSFPVVEPDEARKIRLATDLAGIAGSCGITLRSCADKTDYTSSGIQPSHCVDSIMISKLIGKSISAAKDPNQRKECLCTKSVDIGSYNSCIHGCTFCYANANPDTTLRYYRNFDADNVSL